MASIPPKTYQTVQQLNNTQLNKTIQKINTKKNLIKNYKLTNIIKSTIQIRITMKTEKTLLKSETI